MLRQAGLVLLLLAAAVSGPSSRGGETAPRTGEEGRSVEELRREIEELKRQLREQEERRALERERKDLREKLGKDGEEEGEDDGSEAPEPPGRFEVDRSGMTLGIGTVTVDAGFTAGYKSNLAETHDHREDDSYLRPNFDLLWVHAPGIVVMLHTEENLYVDHDEEDYSRVNLASCLWGVGYGLTHVSDTSNFVSDRIEMTRHEVAINPRLPLAMTGAGALAYCVPSVTGRFVSSGDLEYDDLIVEFGSATDELAEGSGKRSGKKSEEGGELSWSLGLTRRWYETKGFEDDLAMIGRLKYAYRAARWDAAVIVASRLEDDLFALAGHKRVSDLDVTFRYDPNPRIQLTLGAAAGAEDFDAGEDLYDEDRRDFFVRGKLGAKIKVMPHGIIAATYAPELRESSIDEFDAVVHLVELSAKLTF
ncbi:MAG: hypothetical protein ACYTGB_07880 [Planctomycetota bacterium]|jgi:hypothetical protein